MGRTEIQVDFTNYKLPNRQSTKSKLNKSIVDSYTTKLRNQLNDPNLGERFVALALNKLSEAEINNIADYAVRKGNNPGKLFVSICHKEIR